MSSLHFKKLLPCPAYPFSIANFLSFVWFGFLFFTFEAFLKYLVIFGCLFMLKSELLRRLEALCQVYFTVGVQTFSIGNLKQQYLEF